MVDDSEDKMRTDVQVNFKIGRQLRLSQWIEHSGVLWTLLASGAELSPLHRQQYKATKIKFTENRRYAIGTLIRPYWIARKQSLCKKKT